MVTKTGSTETKELQSNIKSIISRLDWSVANLAEVLYTSLNEEDDYEKLDKFKDTLKHQLHRKTTNPEKLLKYLNIIKNDKRFEKLDSVVPFYVSNEEIVGDLVSDMKGLSILLTDKINDK